MIWFFTTPVLTLHLTPPVKQKKYGELFPPSVSKLTSEARPRPLPSRVTSRAGTASAPSGTAGTEGNGGNRKPQGERRQAPHWRCGNRGGNPRGIFGACDFETKKNHCVCGNSMNLYTCMYREKFWRSAMFIVHVDFREVQTRSKFSGDHWDVPNVFLDRLVQESLWIYLDIDGHVNMTARNKMHIQLESEYCTFIHSCDLNMQYQILFYQFTLSMILTLVTVSLGLRASDATSVQHPLEKQQKTE